VLDVLLDRLRRDHQIARDLDVIETARQEPEDLELSPRQPGDGRTR
jgi:hypothetical protein